MSLQQLTRFVTRAFVDRVTNFTAAPEEISVLEHRYDLGHGMAEVVLLLPPGTSLFYDGGDREVNLPQGGKVLTLYDEQSDRWGWYLFWSEILGEFSINPA